MSMAMIRIPLNQREMKMEEWMAMGNGDIFEVREASCDSREGLRGPEGDMGPRLCRRRSSSV